MFTDSLLFLNGATVQLQEHQTVHNAIDVIVHQLDCKPNKVLMRAAWREADCSLTEYFPGELIQPQVSVVLVDSRKASDVSLLILFIA